MTTDGRPVQLKRWQQKELVQSLRRQGLSYREILQQLPFALSKGTISAWCRDIELTPEQLDRLDQLCREGSYRGRLLGPKATQRRRAQEVQTIRAEARLEIQQFCGKPLWVAGVMLYWAEGSKTKDVAFSNSDPSMVRLMMRWFREICHVPEEKFFAQLNIHSGQDDGSAKAFWAGVTGLPLSRFGKSYVKREGTGHRKNILYHGTIRITVCNRNLFHRIQGWIVGLKDCANEILGR